MKYLSHSGSSQNDFINYEDFDPTLDKSWRHVAERFLHRTDDVLYISAQRFEGSSRTVTDISSLIF
jgi:hypothetical protein